VVPRGLVMQWVAEMSTHFNEHFHVILSDDHKSLKRVSAISNTDDQMAETKSLNPFQMFDQVIVSMDSVKPPSNTNGMNKSRFEDLISAGWDLIIVDEAHRLGGSTDQVARYKLGQGLAGAAPYMLLLSATPHQGKTDQFRRLMSLIDPQAFPDERSISRDRVQPYVIRTEKRQAIDAEGKPLFKPRRTELVPVSWKEEHYDQRLLYEAVTEYVREGYNQAMLQKRNYIGFLMILMQRLVVSSTRAIRTTLERRLEALKEPEEQLSLFFSFNEEDWVELDGQEQVDALLKSKIKALDNERDEVELLLELAKRCESKGPDAKAEALLDWIYKLQAEEGDPDLKVLIFTEFVSTQEMLYEFLTERGFNVVCLNGSMNMEERKKVQDAFSKDARILISTDAGGEGLNLQFCHVVINYDIPWNPMKLEQRIGRVDRIGQSSIVRAINFVFDDSIEHRVREVLEDKLEIIFKEFGIDKTGDVLDSAQAGQMFDDLYVKAILDPDTVETKVDEVVSTIKEQALEAKQSFYVLGATENLNPYEAQQLLVHPLPHWVERMTVSYLNAYGGKAERKDDAWDLTWPDGKQMKGLVFNSRDAENNPLSFHLTLEDPRVRGLATKIPFFVSGQLIPAIAIPGLTAEIKGVWSLWKISISAADWSRYRIMPLFLSDSDRVFMPTARHIWDQLLVKDPLVLSYLDVEDSNKIFEQVRERAETYGKGIYEELKRFHQERLEQERKKGEYAFAVRRRIIGHIGLPQVSSHRLKLLEEEEKQFMKQVERRAQIFPELVPLVLARVEGGSYE
ncbi:MAG: DEAD/DEAH box helicase, partial [Deltaproteobacteria bacterium]|nr:DEAD/DEAH box helicase [Deltaproteobacteria bacterium]